MTADEIRCPSNRRHADDLVGCGSADVAGPDDEGIYDCLGCGLWFTPDAADVVEVMT